MPKYKCPNCKRTFDSTAKLVTCDRCSAVCTELNQYSPLPEGKTSGFVFSEKTEIFNQSDIDKTGDTDSFGRTVDITGKQH